MVSTKREFKEEHVWLNLNITLRKTETIISLLSICYCLSVRFPSFMAINLHSSPVVVNLRGVNVPCSISVIHGLYILLFIFAHTIVLLWY